MTTQYDKIYRGLSSEAGSTSFLWNLYLSVDIVIHQIFFWFIVEFRIAPSGMAWKGGESENVVAIQATDIKWAQWIRVARGFQLRVGLKDHKKEKFEGFAREVRACLSNRRVSQRSYE